MKIKNLLESYRNKNKTGLVRFLKNNQILWNEFYDICGISENISENLYCYYNEITSIPKCPYCGHSLKFISLTKGYSLTCGDKNCISKNKSKTNSIRLTSRSCKLSIEYSKQELEDEFNFYKNVKGNIKSNGSKFKIIKQFQQNIFFKNEKEFLNIKSNKDWMIENRRTFLNKKEISTSELISGCKITGKTDSYSHFQPLWIKWFCETYNIQTLFDPCGGWGHRLLGCLNLKKYVYNDIDKNVSDNIRRIVNFFEIKNTEIHSKDIRKFDFDTLKDIEAWFTCPPYVDFKGNNIEHYSCGDYSSKEYSEILLTIVSEWKKSPSQILGLVIREDIFDYYLRNFLSNYHNIQISYETVGREKTSHLSKNKERKYKENLYIIQKI